MTPQPKIVDGQNILYHYIQKSILKEEEEFSKELIQHLLIDLSIWIPTNFYHRLPIILPYVVRDNSCRKKRENGQDEWGSANSKGFLRDDNSLIKGIVRSFPIRSTKILEYKGKKLGTGFVACHIWGKLNLNNEQIISSRHYMLNSFVPNLVWLPVQISKLTDREGSYAQRVLQEISWQIYRDINLPEDLRDIWRILEKNRKILNLRVQIEKLNYFEVTDKWLNKRLNGLVYEIDEIKSLRMNYDGRKVKTSRYLSSLQRIPIEERKELYEWLSKYRIILKA
ncbi:MAG: hypothetical protein IAX22_00495 [Candidatus Bathyarchaeota archaeon]|nr:hypothetical protein [Candidatus Bathyarchaeota archaeon]